MTTLAEYNNNPGNIKPAKGVKYEGLIGVDEQGHGIFQNPEQGQKALINDLTYKLEKRGIKTPAEFVDAYNPAREGVDEEARDNYKIYIAQKLGLRSTGDQFPENAISNLAQAVTAFEGGSWQAPAQGEKAAEKAVSEPSAADDQYGPTKISEGQYGEESQGSPKELAAIGSILGAGAGAVYETKAPIFRLAQKVGLFDGKPITPADAAKLAERVMSQGQSAETAGGKWAAKTGYGMGEGTVQETSSRYQRAMPSGKVSGPQSKRFGPALPGESPDVVQRMIDRANATKAAQAAQASQEACVESRQRAR